MDIQLTVAQNVKQARETKKLSLDGAAQITGVSKSMLGQIERGEVNPTISVLWKIANGLKIPFTSLIEPELKSVQKVEGAAVQPLLADDGRYRNYPIFPFDAERGFELYRIEIAPNGSLSAEGHLRGCEEYITVFAGQAEITVNGAAYLLNQWDSLSFPADTPHSYRNTGDEPVQMSMVITYSR